MMQNKGMLRLVCFYTYSFMHSLELSLTLFLSFSFSLFFFLFFFKVRTAALDHSFAVCCLARSWGTRRFLRLPGFCPVSEKYERGVGASYGPLQVTELPAYRHIDVFRCSFYKENVFLQCWDRADRCVDHHGDSHDTDGEGKASISPRDHYLDERTKGHAGSDIGTNTHTHKLKVTCHVALPNRVLEVTTFFPSFCLKLVQLVEPVLFC